MTLKDGEKENAALPWPEARQAIRMLDFGEKDAATSLHTLHDSNKRRLCGRFTTFTGGPSADLLRTAHKYGVVACVCCGTSVTREHL